MGVFVQAGTVAERHMEHRMAVVLAVADAYSVGSLDTQGSGNVDMEG